MSLGFSHNALANLRVVEYKAQAERSIDAWFVSAPVTRSDRVDLVDEGSIVTMKLVRADPHDGT